MTEHRGGEHSAVVEIGAAQAQPLEGTVESGTMDAEQAGSDSQVAGSSLPGTANGGGLKIDRSG
jgi:hypothetical protein